MNKALIVIDYVYDFVADDGKLTCGSIAQEIDSKIESLVSEFDKNNDFIVVAIDNHDENDLYNKERGMFPLHCFDEVGQALYGNTKDIINKLDKSKLINIQKSRYSAFYGTSLDLKLKERKVNEIHLVGVCTDICILHTAIDAYNLGYEIVIHKEGVASFNQEGHNYSLTHFTNVLGAKVI